MRLVITTLAVLATALPAAAINRYQSKDMNCAKIHSVIAQEGAAVIYFPLKKKTLLPHYDRFVQNGSYCLGNAAVERFTILARGEQCKVNICTHESRSEPESQSNDVSIDPQ